MTTAGRALERWMKGNDLARAEVRELFGLLMDGHLEEVEKAALLVALATKGETAEEIAGAAEAMRARVVPVPHARECIDTCGTGGDAKGTYNISTGAALLAAAGGAVVAKHGNRSVSSRSGSADVLELLGVPLDAQPERLGRCLDEVGIAFLFAPRLHPAMSAIMPVRRALGVRTVFNLLGPLTNPAGARRQVVGVYEARLVPIVARVLRDLGAIHALVVHGEDGLDELTTTGPSLVSEVWQGEVRELRVEPEQVGLRRVGLSALEGGTARENADALTRVLSGAEPTSPLAEITALNAGAALYVAGIAGDLATGVVQAKELLESGAGLDTLDRLREHGRT